MWQFGIYADRDSFFVGGEPGRWIGIHVDLPWSEDCKQYGAPYMIYVHWWPGHCKSWSVPIISNENHPLNKKIAAGLLKGHRRQPMKPICQVDGCGLDGVGYVRLSARVKRYMGVYSDKGMMTSTLCQKHADEFDLRTIRLVVPE